MLKYPALALLASAMLVACGGGDGGTTATTPSSKTTAAAVTVAAAEPSTAVAPAPTPAPRALETDPNLLEAALSCSSNFGPNAGRAVLLVPGATQTPASEYSWSYIPALDKIGQPWCAVTLPFNNTNELQNSSEYITYAIRKMFGITKTKIAIVGFSQGGAMPRWSLKYFPETRGMVEELIGLAPSSRGLIELNAVCATPCATSLQQIKVGSKWLAALNDGGETFAGIDYTTIYTRTDDIAIPAVNEEIGVSPLRTGNGNRANIATQDVCPLNTADHFILGSSDPVGYALVLDALNNPGTAKTSRVKARGLGLCLEPVMPGVNLATFPLDFAGKMMTSFVNSIAFAPKAATEPELKCYATGGC